MSLDIVLVRLVLIKMVIASGSENSEWYSVHKTKPSAIDFKVSVFQIQKQSS